MNPRRLPPVSGAMLDPDRILVHLSRAALQAVVETTSGVKWTEYGTCSRYYSVTRAAQQLGLKLISRDASFEPISFWQLEWKARCDCSVVLDVHRQMHCSVRLACKDKDGLLRKRQQQDFEEYVDTNSNKLKEARLETILLDRPPVELQGFPYLCERDYTSGEGKGDLVFTDGQGLYAVIEVKYINLQGSNVKQKRKKVRKQAYKYGQAFRARTSAAVVVLAAFYTEESDSLQWITLAGQDVVGVRQLVTAVAAATSVSGPASSGESVLSHSTQDLADSEATTAGMPTCGVAKRREPFLSDEAKQCVVVGLGVVAAIGLGLLIDSRRRQQCRQEQEDPEMCFFLICVAIVLALIIIVGLYTVT